MMLKLRFLGKTIIEYANANIAEQFRGKTVALLCLLVLNADRCLSRERLLAYLWPDSSEESAKNNLRFHLWLIKKNIGPDSQGEEFLIVDKEQCHINKRYQFQCDILQIHRFSPYQCYDIGELIEIKKLFVGEFLEGFYYSSCDDFNELIIIERSRFENYQVHILKRLAFLYEESGAIDEQLKILKEILDLEPYDEEIAEKVLKIYNDIGNRSAGVLFYNSFRDQLASRLGIQPSERIKLIFDKLRDNKDTIKPDSTSYIPSLQELNLCINGIPSIKFFWISRLCESLFQEKRLSCDNRINESEKESLGYIAPAILTSCGSGVHVSDAAIVCSFLKLLSSICSDTLLNINIGSRKQIDDYSLSVISYLESEGFKNFRINESQC